MFSCIAFLFISCAPSTYYLKSHSIIRDRERGNDKKRNKDYINQDISSFNYNEKNDYNDYEDHITNKSNSNTKNKINNNSNNRDKINNNNYNNKITTNKIIAYTVRKGDNLYKISRKFNTTPDTIANLNNITNRNRIFAGMILKISAPGRNTQRNAIYKNSAKKSNPKFIWPLKEIYGTKRDTLEGVKPIGIIITGKYNTPVFSSADGIVTKVGHMRGFGNYIILKHRDKYLTIYSNLGDIKVSEGNQINKGENIGSLDGNKLHFQISYAGKPEDPFKYLSRKT